MSKKTHRIFFISKNTVSLYCFHHLLIEKYFMPTPMRIVVGNFLYQKKIVYLYYVNIHIDFFKLLKRQPRYESGLLYLYKCPDFNYNITHDDDSDDIQRIESQSLPFR